MSRLKNLFVSMLGLSETGTVPNPYLQYGPRVTTDKNVGKSYGLEYRPFRTFQETTASGRTRTVTELRAYNPGKTYPYHSPRRINGGQ